MSERMEYGYTSPDDLRYPTNYEESADVPLVFNGLAEDVQIALLRRDQRRVDTVPPLKGGGELSKDLLLSIEVGSGSGSLAPGDHTHVAVTSVTAGSGIGITGGTGTGAGPFTGNITISATGTGGSGGTVWFTGDGLPVSVPGSKPGDMYLDNLTGDYFVLS